MISEQAGELFGYAKVYGEQQFKLIKLDVAERFSRVTAGLALLLVLFVVILFILLLFSVALGIYLGELWQSYTTAFLSIAGFYVFIGILLLVFRKSLIVNPILAMMINEMMDQDEE
ncbi:MAG: phage holin family protein [Saprospiraceae bacterium]|nr:phage holin family protein [Saprospiraceae bacterium]